MTDIGGMTSNQPIGSRLARLPLVVLLTIGLLLSLLHCTDLSPFSGKAVSPVVTMNDQHGSTPDLPEHLLPCHSGHCLSHVTAQSVTTVLVPTDEVMRQPAFGSEQFPASIAGLPLFKPPRA